MMNEIKRTNILQLINPEVGPGSVTQLLQLDVHILVDLIIITTKRDKYLYHRSNQENVQVSVIRLFSSEIMTTHVTSPDPVYSKSRPPVLSPYISILLLELKLIRIAPTANLEISTHLVIRDNTSPLAHTLPFL